MSKVKTAMKKLCYLLAAVLLHLSTAPAATPEGWRKDGTAVYPDAQPPIKRSATKNVIWKTPLPKKSNASQPGSETAARSSYAQSAVPDTRPAAPSTPFSPRVWRNTLWSFPRCTQGIGSTAVAWTSPVSSEPIPVNP